MFAKKKKIEKKKDAEQGVKPMLAFAADSACHDPPNQIFFFLFAAAISLLVESGASQPFFFFLGVYIRSNERGRRADERPGD